MDKCANLLFRHAGHSTALEGDALYETPDDMEIGPDLKDSVLEPSIADTNTYKQCLK